AVLRLSHNINVPFSHQQRPQSLSHHGVVVSQNNSNLLHSFFGAQPPRATMENNSVRILRQRFHKKVSKTSQSRWEGSDLFLIATDIIPCGPLNRPSIIFLPQQI